jgi:hypothetical protein
MTAITNQSQFPSESIHSLRILQIVLQVAAIHWSELANEWKTPSNFFPREKFCHKCLSSDWKTSERGGGWLRTEYSATGTKYISPSLLGHESLYSIAQTNLRHVTQHTTSKTTEDCPDPTSLSQVPENKQCKFILKHKSKLPTVLERGKGCGLVLSSAWPLQIQKQYVGPSLLPHFGG